MVAMFESGSMSDALKVVIADDEPDIRDYFRKLLPRLGFTVAATVGNGQELIETCRQERPDFVVTDVKMPVLDGLQAAARVYAEQGIPAVVMTADTIIETLRRAELEHVCGFVGKPIRQDDLRYALDCAMVRCGVQPGANKT